MKKIGILAALTSLSTAFPAQAADALATWRTSVTRLIADNQSYPRSAQIRGEQGTTRLNIKLAADGRINQVDVTASSGSAILDREAQSLISRIARFPAPPAGVQNLSVPIVWRLN